MVKQLIDEYFSLLEYCSSSEFDLNMFKIKHDNLTYQYKKLDYQQQGEYTYLINESI